MSDGIDWAVVQDEAVRILQGLLRIDTTNPPGNERAAAEYLAEILRSEGLEPTLVGATPERPAVIARLAGSGERGPLLLQGHTDVVPADPSEWRYPPFSGELAEGCLWGRGALDMKGTLVMQLAALVTAKRQGLRPRGDLIFCGVPDEEAGGFEGAGWLVDHHPELVRAEVGLGEVGGFSMYLGDACFYPLQVSEKVGCQVRLRISGQGGHGSMPIRDGAMAKLARVLEALTRRRLPLHVEPVSERFIRTLAEAEPALLGLLDPRQADGVLAELGEGGRLFEAVLTNTAAPTVVSGGSKTNVIPGSIELTLDGRLLPGHTSEEFIGELHDLLGDDAEVLDVRHNPSFTEAPVDDFFELLAETIEAMDPGARAVPMMISGITDARHFARLGTRGYGFGPVKLQRDASFWSLFHGANERIPIEGLGFGSEAIYRVLSLY